MSVESIRAALDAHRISAFGPDDCACVCDRTWRKHTEWRTHVAEVIAALMPEASESVEWGVRYDRDPSTAFPVSEQNARELAAESDDIAVVCRTAWRTAWTEVRP